MTKKLLLADDSITIQKVIGIIFATEDYELHVCDDGDQAFTKALQEYPDLVIADVSMPGKDGFELCQAIKAENGLAHTSVLLLPGTFDHFDESRAEEVGADGWLSKPFESQALLDKVAQLLDAEPTRPASSEEVATPEVAAVANEESVEELSAPEDTGVDEVVLGLDEVDELEPAPAEASVEEESADDIWDAVSFEEEDLQTSDDLAPAAETDLVEEFVAEESVSPVVDETPAEGEDVSEDSGFVFGGEDEPLEIIDTVEESELEPEIEQPLELEEESIVAEEEELEPEIEEELVELSDESADGDEFVVEDAIEDVPVVEPLDEEMLEEDEEILDLAEDDILDEEPAEELAAVEPAPEPTVEEPVDLEPEPAEEEIIFSDEPVVVDEPESVEEFEVASVEEPLEEIAEEPIAEIEPEIAEEPDASEDEGFYYDSAEPEEDESIIAPAAALAAGAAVAATVDTVSPVDQAEQQLRELSEDELKEVVEKVAGPTIEKLANEMLEQIVWEVVPDLAESMIREEIRKIRQGAE